MKLDGKLAAMSPTGGWIIAAIAYIRGEACVVRFGIRDEPLPGKPDHESWADLKMRGTHPGQ